MFKFVSSAFVVAFAVSVSAQFWGPIPVPQLTQITSYLNNITMTDIAKILRYLPIPNPVEFDGFPLSQNDVSFYLYTRRNPENPVRLKRLSTIFHPLDPHYPVKFIIHGWMESVNSSYYPGFISAFLRRGEYNVIAVDWSTPAWSEYTISSRNTKTAGRALAEFILRLSKATGVPMSQMHIIGHSLGGHLAGFAGKHVMKRSGNRVGRITALDAAGPLFESPIPVRKINRLDRGDADFVDCIHTDGGIFGMVQPIGHADFYPNGGLPRQPGCSALNIAQLSSRVIIQDSFWSMLRNTLGMINKTTLFCSHMRSHELYTESINSDRMKAVSCGSYGDFRAGLCAGRQVVLMGEDADVRARGKYYLDTNAESPFARD